MKRRLGQSEPHVSTDCTARVCHMTRARLLQHIIIARCCCNAPRALRGLHPNDRGRCYSSLQQREQAVHRATQVAAQRLHTPCRWACFSCSLQAVRGSSTSIQPIPGYPPSSYRRPVTVTALLVPQSREKRKRNHTTSSDDSHADNVILLLLLHRCTKSIIVIVIVPSQQNKAIETCLAKVHVDNAYLLSSNAGSLEFAPAVHCRARRARQPHPYSCIWTAHTTSDLVSQV